MGSNCCKVLVTGGSGFIGLNLIRGLVARGHQVVSLSRSGASARDMHRLLGDKAGMVRAEAIDVRNATELAASVEAARPDVVIHSAAMITLGGDEQPQFAQTVATNTQATVSVLEATRKTGAKKALYISSAGIYGARRNLRPLSETEHPHLPGLYAISKYAGELLWRRYASVFGMDARIARISCAYGPWERVRSSRSVVSDICTWCLAALEGQAVDEPSDLPRDYTYVDDTVDGLLKVALADRTRYPLYNVACGRLYWRSEALATMAELVPGFQYRIGPWSEGKPKWNPPRGPLMIERLSREFSFSPTVSLREGLQRQLDWLRAESGQSPNSGDAAIPIRRLSSSNEAPVLQNEFRRTRA